VRHVRILAGRGTDPRRSSLEAVFGMSADAVPERPRQTLILPDELRRQSLVSLRDSVVCRCRSSPRWCRIAERVARVLGVR
jgi:hypothetical protein